MPMVSGDRPGIKDSVHKLKHQRKVKGQGQGHMIVHQLRVHKLLRNYSKSTHMTPIYQDIPLMDTKTPPSNI